ncbi:PREDICTED: glutathione S-transferase theta-1-like [Nicrophorus vespilloides]|uniref:Glutathione S-transferase theta-1-like n=1 Tax=Nicrophorus vespilloides TaxID=110193 RepID=A0ABM1NDR5_NICVS|nr:PREDICTED: glutathione S-transferase theta-1-like [Nicrophorus vespilloides]
MSLKLYYDFLSQPSRALYILLKTSKLPFEDCPVALRNGAHLNDEFKYNVSRFQKVPVIHDGDFKLTESVAILRYLSREKNLPEFWYPKDSKKQARVDEFLEWQHNNVRAFCALYFQKKWLFPIITGKEMEPKKLAGYKKRMEDCLDSMEILWLSNGKYICGDNLTAADLWAACEVEQPRLASYDPTVGRPILGAWLDRVRSELGENYRVAHEILNKIATKSQKAKM